MSDNKDRVCAVVVTYNRKQLLLECLEALTKQSRPLQAIYLIDNASTDGTPEILLEKKYIQELPPQRLKEPWEKEFEIKNLIDGQPIKLYYVRVDKNVGGSGGFYEGVKRGYERGYDWLWLMDDDSEPVTNCLENLISRSDKETVILCPYIKGEVRIQKYYHKRFNFLLMERKWNIDGSLENKIEIDANAFIGPLIRVESIKVVGLPFKDFFIMDDDTEYTYRFKRTGKLYLIKDAIILHKDKKPQKKDFDSLSALIWKKYYCYRNRIIFIKMNLTVLFFIISLIIFTFKSLKSPLWLLIKRKVGLNISLLPIKGIIDGCRGISGKSLEINEIMDKFKR